MGILEYRGLNSCVIEQKYNKLVNMLEQDDFCSADIKKSLVLKYYRAKLDYKNRLLYTFVTYQKQRLILILEVIHNHAYDCSRFLRNHKQFSDKKTLDEDTWVAALLHDIVEDAKITLLKIEAMFNLVVAKLVDGVTKFDRTIGYAIESKQKKIAEQTLQFYVPMAKNLGLIDAAKELQSLVFETLTRISS